VQCGVVTGLLPVTGMPLPLLSYGGSGLLCTLIGIGLVLGVSRQSGRAACAEMSLKDETARVTDGVDDAADDADSQPSRTAPMSRSRATQGRTQAQRAGVAA
jgi:cell division protein FtsW